MTWFVNCSQRVQAVPTGDGNVVAVRPNDRVEVKVELPEIKRLMGLRVLARAGRTERPVKVRVMPDAVPVVIVPTPFAQEIHEKEVLPKKVEASDESNAAVESGSVDADNKWNQKDKRGRRR